MNYRKEIHILNTGKTLLCNSMFYKGKITLKT